MGLRASQVHSDAFIVFVGQWFGSADLRSQHDLANAVKSGFAGFKFILYNSFAVDEPRVPDSLDDLRQPQPRTSQHMVSHRSSQNDATRSKV
ncbi:hypothetical protein O9K51_05286 [Purpureocillium lavendulum]|uniref:Uncharacterized protein n=1 Tax=Purpureocillium lavendulum TaxID=1247861 RepID=A0AB34FUJ3_9HYPO|nr:hypothetical protein O9K51_05286 [Purpureocillium lavendulum]